MNSFPLAWAIAAALLLATMYAIKSIRLKRLAGQKQLHWRGATAISVIGGAIVAFVFVTLTADEVALPPELANSPTIATPGETR